VIGAQHRHADIVQQAGQHGFLVHAGSHRQAGALHDMVRCGKRQAELRLVQPQGENVGQGRARRQRWKVLLRRRACGFGADCSEGLKAFVLHKARPMPPRAPAAIAAQWPHYRIVERRIVGDLRYARSDPSASSHRIDRAARASCQSARPYSEG